MNAFGEVIEYKLKNGENNKDYSYTYDSNGNITSISLNGDLKQTFTYNSSNELVRVDDAVMNKTITYGYDYVGNITAVNIYSYTTGELGTPEKTETYDYNSQNQRTDLSYDAYGNLTALNDFSFTWDGRRLATAVNDDTETNTNTNISYTYNHNGIRTSKTINGITTYYIVDENNNVVKQYNSENNVETNVIEFVYDNDGAPIYIVYNGAVYYYEKNLQGDIVAILDSDRNTVVQYTYDIWGKLLGISGTLADTLGISNPLRYRGYYYDTETSLYYLQSRYYSPDLMRFISQDDPVYSNEQGQPLGSNLYVYCGNDAINYIDFNGYISYKIAIPIGWCRRPGGQFYSKKISCLNKGFVYQISFYVVCGSCDRRNYEKLKYFDIKVAYRSKKYTLTKVYYYYGSSNIFYAQRAQGSTTKSSLHVNAPSKWLGVNIASSDDIRAMVGVSVDVYFKDNKTKYHLYFIYTTSEYEFLLYRYEKGKWKVIDFGRKYS